MPDKERDFTYERAPVVEVIAEVQWQLKPILGADLFLDPFFDALADGFTPAITDRGYTHIEQVAPSEFPQEFLSYKPYFRYRQRPDSWPLYQIGPGLFSANITPPYQGWRQFSGIISEGLRILYEQYPLADRHLKPKQLKLVYINAFGKEHGFRSQEEFINDGLNFQIGISPKLSQHTEEGSLSIVSEFTFKLKNLKDSFSRVKLGSGISNGSSALIVENTIYKNVEHLTIGRTEIEEWFNEARSSNHDMFESYITEKTRTTFGQRKNYD